MSKATKVTLIIATVCLALGMVLSGTAVALAGFDVRNLSTNSEYQYQQRSVQAGTVSQIKFSGASEAISIEPGSAETIEVEYYENDRQSYSIEETNGTLKITESINFTLMMWNFDIMSDHKVVVKVPESFSGSIMLDSASGDVSVSDFQELSEISANSVAGNVVISKVNAQQGVVATSGSGDVTLSAIGAQTVEATTMSGSCKIDNVTAYVRTKFESTSGDVDFAAIESPTIQAKSMSGDVVGSQLGSKTIAADSTSGSVSLLINSVDILSANTMSGDIDVTVVGVATDYAISTSSTSGSVRAPSGNAGAEKSITLGSTSGDIDLAL